MLPRIGTAWNSSSVTSASRNGGAPNQAVNAAKPAYSRYAQPAPSRQHAGSDSEADSFAETESDEFSSDSDRRSRSAPLIRPGQTQLSQKQLAATAAPLSGHEEALRAHLRNAQNSSPNGPRQVVLRPLGQDQQQQQRAETSGPGPRAAERGRPAAAPIEVYDMSKRGAGGGGGGVGVGGAEISDSDSDDADGGGDAAGRSVLQRNRAAAAAAAAAGREPQGGQELRTKYGVTVQVDRVADMGKYADFDRCPPTAAVAPDSPRPAGVPHRHSPSRPGICRNSLSRLIAASLPPPSLPPSSRLPPPGQEPGLSGPATPTPHAPLLPRRPRTRQGPGPSALGSIHAMVSHATAPARERERGPVSNPRAAAAWRAARRRSSARPTARSRPPFPSQVTPLSPPPCQVRRKVRPFTSHPHPPLPPARAAPPTPREPSRAAHPRPGPARDPPRWPARDPTRARPGGPGVREWRGHSPARSIACSLRVYSGPARLRAPESGRGAGTARAASHPSRATIRRAGRPAGRARAGDNRR